MTTPNAEMPSSERGRWLLGLRDLAQKWVGEQKRAHARAQTAAYADLIFAFGLARLGEPAAARELQGRAHRTLSTLDEAHEWLLQAYEYRIRQALEGKPHAGTLSVELVERVEPMYALLRYVVDRLRKHSRILEPDQRINPYRWGWGDPTSDFDRDLTELWDLQDPRAIIQSVRNLFERSGHGKHRNERRTRILVVALNKAPWVDEEFGRDILQQALTAYDALPESVDRELHLAGVVRQLEGTVLGQLLFLESALFVLATFQLADLVEPWLARTKELLSKPVQPPGVFHLAGVVRQCIRALRALRMPDELDQFLYAAADLILQGQPVQAWQFQERRGLGELPWLLGLAEGWYWFGWSTLAEPVVNAAWTILVQGELAPREQTFLACSYAGAVALAPLEQSHRCLEGIFRDLQGIRDTYTTSTHFSVSQVEVLEAVVLAAVEAWSNAAQSGSATT